MVVLAVASPLAGLAIGDAGYEPLYHPERFA